MSIRIKDLPSKTTIVSDTTILASEDSVDIDATRGVVASDLRSYDYNLSDEDSPLTIGIAYTSKVSTLIKKLNELRLSVKNAPTGSKVKVDALLETAQDSNSFSTIFTTQPTIDITKFSSVNAVIAQDLLITSWPANRRMQFIITQVDSNNSATGLKAEIL